ncbi:sulfotransferase [Cupriavidus consociatus]|uniref:sulfotransferase n=1 Tax=Cupriavidus consociatus TaxID=2821357 RepID=UPI001AE35B75|nr:MULTISPECIES: sulfotransferase [unclassified Cupriavidus]MBP0625151.1 sulfotransferase [Cupriavidus sp. LEh25]MDK2661890.1 sulfotransferase [Cupriavidus sp. LEh21]
MTNPVSTTRSFVILGMPRTGTHYLEELLNEHPNVLSNGELLNPYDMKWPDRKRLLRGDRELLELAYLNFPGAGKIEVTHVGCKINQPQFQERPGFFEELIRWPRLQAILMLRRNTLESLRSLAQARQSGQWLKFDADADLGTPPQVTLKIEVCEAYFKAADDFHHQVWDGFLSENILTIEYENLLGDSNACLQSVCAFLGTSAHQRPRRNVLQRQEMRPLEETVLNFSELKRHFSGGCYEKFF